MMLDELLKLASEDRGPFVAWGDVNGVSPTLVRFAGDTTDTQVDLWLTSYTPTTNDRVILLRAGSAWVILGDMV